MSRPTWSLHAYHVIQPDEQLDLFACREGWLHGVERQLALAGAVDRTLCGVLLPAQPVWGALDADLLKASFFCPSCRAEIRQQRKVRQPGWNLPLTDSTPHRLPLDV